MEKQASRGFAMSSFLYSLGLAFVLIRHLSMCSLALSIFLNLVCLGPGLSLWLVWNLALFFCLKCDVLTFRE